MLKTLPAPFLAKRDTRGLPGAFHGPPFLAKRDTRGLPRLPARAVRRPAVSRPPERVEGSSSKREVEGRVTEGSESGGQTEFVLQDKPRPELVGHISCVGVDRGLNPTGKFNLFLSLGAD